MCRDGAAQPDPEVPCRADKFGDQLIDLGPQCLFDDQHVFALKFLDLYVILAQQAVGARVLVERKGLVIDE